jgi:hypothetical protein
MMAPETRDEWPIPDEVRKPVVMRQASIAINVEMKVADAIAAARCLTAMNGQNIAVRSATEAPQIHVPGHADALINLTPEQRRDRLSAIAERLRARRLAGRMFLSGSGEDADPTPDSQTPEGTGGGEPA